MTKNNEIWKDISDYEGYYQISNYGRVQSLDRVDALGRFKEGKILKPKKHNYLVIGLWKNGKAKDFSISRLVAIAFHPNPLGLPEVNHKDENKFNNCSDNLEWCTRKYNANYGSGIKRMAQAHDYKSIGAKNAERLSMPVIATDTDTGKTFTFASTRDAERRGFGNQSDISRCCRGLKKKVKGHTWKYAV